jgi:hypothetical protein
MRNTNHDKMTTNTLSANMIQKLINCGVKVIELPSGAVQLLGMYGTILLTHDVTTLRPKQIEQLCGDSA